MKLSPPLAALVAVVPLALILVTAVAGVDVDSNCTCNTTSQRLVLLDFFRATDGPSWSVQLWNFTDGRTPCNFSTTITCANASVVSISLANANLGGTLPASLANLSGQLTALDVSGNPRLSGSLPPEWGALVNLTLLHASSTGLVGPLPSSFGSLVALKELHLDYTHLNATLPESWAGMTNMVYFSLQNASLFGTLPPAYSAWTKVRLIMLRDNGNISGTLPPEWNLMRKLQDFHLTNNALNGTLPKEYALMSSLSLINVGFNPLLGGTLPSEWSSMKSIEFLMLYACNFSGSLPAEWSAMNKSMREISISLNPHLTGTLPASWGAFSAMEEFYAFRCNLTGTLPSEWSTWNKAWNIMMPQNRIIGTLPKSWAGLKTLQQLVLTGNALNGTLPPEWSALTSLTSVFLDYNLFTGTLPAAWGTSWPFVFALFLGFNQLHGTLPAAWSSIGSIANQFGNSLWSFIGNYGLTGTIPSAYPAISLLGICNTSLCGSIPSSWRQSSNPSFVCQTLSQEIFNVLQNPDIGDKEATILRIAHSQPTEIRLLPACPTTAAPPTTTSSPGTTVHPTTAAAAVSVVVSRKIMASATPAAVVASSASSLLITSTPTFSVAPALQSSLSALKVAAKACGVVPVSSPSSGGSGEEEVLPAIDDVVGSAIGDNPMQLDLGGSASLAGGTVVGNTVLVLTCGPVVLLIRSVLEAYWKQGAAAELGRHRRKRHGRSGGEETDDRAEARKRPFIKLHLSNFFLTMVPFYGALLQPTIAASVSLLTITPQSVELWTVGVAGLLVHVLPLLYSGRLLLVTYSARLRCLAEVHPYLRRKAKLLRLVYANFVPTCRWELPPTTESSSRVRTNHMETIARKLTLTLTEPYHHPYHWMSLVELGTALVSGVLTGVALALPNTTPCRVLTALQWCIAALFAAAAVVAVALRPTSTRFDWIQSAVMNGLSAAVVVLSVLQLDSLAVLLSAAQALAAAVVLVLPAAALVFRWMKGATTVASAPGQGRPTGTGDELPMQRPESCARADLVELRGATVYERRLRDLVDEICYQQRLYPRGGSSKSKREPDAKTSSPSLSDALWLT